MSTTIERGLRCAAFCLLTSSCFAAGNNAVERFGIGSTATADELKNFVSPLPDGRGLPPGSGSVMQGFHAGTAENSAKGFVSPNRRTLSIS